MSNGLAPGEYSATFVNLRLLNVCHLLHSLIGQYVNDENIPILSTLALGSNEITITSDIHGLINITPYACQPVEIFTDRSFIVTQKLIRDIRATGMQFSLNPADFISVSDEFVVLKLQQSERYKLEYYTGSFSHIISGRSNVAYI
jgi:hypothetical protein